MMDLEFKYIANKYCGEVYCGNGFFGTIEECMEFAKDGFCDKVKILEVETNKKQVIKF